jgi:hypothetical protein
MTTLHDSIAAFSSELRTFAAQTTEGISGLRRTFSSKPCVGREDRLPQHAMHMNFIGLMASMHLLSWSPLHLN